jgi:hypothetical protein
MSEINAGAEWKTLEKKTLNALSYELLLGIKHWAFYMFAALNP